MYIKIEDIRHYRLCAHHLDRKLSQTGIQAAVGGAVVSFLLRPCSFESLVVFGCSIGL